MSDLLLEMKKLRVEARGADGATNAIVNNLDLRLERGEVLGLIGESGAGKSTIGLAAMAYARTGCRIAGGQVIFDGTDLMQEDEETLREMRGVRGNDVAMIFQEPMTALNPLYAVGEQIAEVLRLIRAAVANPERHAA